MLSHILRNTTQEMLYGNLSMLPISTASVIYMDLGLYSKQQLPSSVFRVKSSPWLVSLNYFIMASDGHYRSLYADYDIVTIDTLNT